MLRRVMLVVPMGTLLASSVWAKEPRVEIGGVVGYTLSEGVSGDAVLGGDGNIYNSIDPKSAFAFGFNVGYHVTENAEAGFMWNRQLSQLLINGTATRTIGDMNVDNYHGYFAYNFGDSDAKVRPYVMGGMGATDFASVNFSVAGQQRQTSGETQFSFTWGGGVKVYANRNVGAKLGARWTPTYIKTDPGGWWCDPYWGCYVVGNTQYSNQLVFDGGVVFRF